MNPTLRGPRVTAGKRERQITREDLIHRYVNAAPPEGSVPLTYSRAVERLVAYDDEQLRARVEYLEGEEIRPGQRQSFARSQPTTSLQGQTR